MRIKAFYIKQNGFLGDVGIYLSSLPALELIERHAFDRRTPESIRSYQCLPLESRFGIKRASSRDTSSGSEGAFRRPSS